MADQEYKSAFYSELAAFKQRIVKRAAEKIAEAVEEERLANLGPGGLDPSEVFESLPQAMKDCFESQDIAMLQQVIKEMPEEDARWGLDFFLLRLDLFIPPPAQVPHEAVRGLGPVVPEPGGPRHLHRGRLRQARGGGRGGGGVLRGAVGGGVR